MKLLDTQVKALKYTGLVYLCAGLFIAVIIYAPKIMFVLTMSALIGICICGTYSLIHQFVKVNERNKEDRKRRNRWD